MKLCLDISSARHGEFAVMYRPFAAHVAGNPYVVGRISKNELGFFAIQKASIVAVLESATAQHAVLTEEPEVTGLGDGRIR